MPGEYAKFLSAITAAVTPVAMQSIHEDPSGTHAWMRSVLTGEPPDTRAKPSALRRDDAFITSLFRGFAEISGTFESLKTRRSRSPVHFSDA